MSECANCPIGKAAKELADFIRRSTNVGPVTNGPHREAKLWRALRDALNEPPSIAGVS